MHAEKERGKRLSLSLAHIIPLLTHHHHSPSSFPSPPFFQILRIVISPAAPAQGSANGPPSLKCTITYASRDEAEQAVLAVDNVVLDGRTLKASFGSAPVALGSRENPRTQAATAVEPEPEPEPPQVEPTPSAPVPVSQRNGGDRGSRYSNENRPSVPVSAAAQAANERNNAANIAGSAVLAASDPVYTPATSYSGGGGNAAPVGGRQAQPQNGNGGVTGVGGLLDVSDPVVSVGGSTIGGGPDAMAGVRLGIGRDAVGGGGNNNANHGGRPTGAGDEPWSMNSFEDLLNGLVGDEPEVEEAEMPMNSRFARFFADPNDQPYNPHQPGGRGPGNSHPHGAVPQAQYHNNFYGGQADGGASALAGLGGIALDDPFGNAGKPQAAPQDDWAQQSDFRALLPNVNISFSPFGDNGQGPGGGQMQPGGQMPQQQPNGGLGGLGGLGAFDRGPVGNPGGGGGGGAFNMGGGAFDSMGLGAGAMNGNLPGLSGGGAPGGGGQAAGAADLLQQLTAGSAAAGVNLPGAQPPISGLSSQLQSLLSGGNGAGNGGAGGPALGTSRAPGAVGAVGRGGNGNGAEAAAVGGANGSLPGWLTADVLAGKVLPEDVDGGLDGEDKGDGKKHRGHGGSDRGGKNKKRGGTSNRSKQGGEGGGAAGGKGAASASNGGK